MVTVPLLAPPAEVTVRPAFSKVSLASTLVVTLPSSATVTALLAASTTGVTFTVITRVALWPSLSVTRTVKVSLPW